MTRHDQRLLLGLGGVYTLQVASELIPGMHETEAREWLENEGLVRTVRGRKLVCWVDVIERIRGTAIETGEPTTPVKLRLAKV